MKAVWYDEPTPTQEEIEAMYQLFVEAGKVGRPDVIVVGPREAERIAKDGR